MKDFYEYFMECPFLNILQYLNWTLVAWLMVICLLKGSYLVCIFDLLMFGYWVWCYTHNFLKWQQRKNVQRAIDMLEDYINKYMKEV